MVKRILREMRIMELSAVDNPAQEGATFVLAKRATGEDSDMDETKRTKDSEMGYMSADKPKKPGDKPKPGSCDCDKPQFEDGKCKKCGKSKGKGLTDSDAEGANSENAVTKSGEETMTDAEKLAETEAALAVEIAKGAKLVKVATLSDVEKDHYNGLVELDAEGADKFLDASKDDRAVEIEKAKSADPIIYTDSEGTEYHKSESKMAAVAKRADAAEKENKALKEAGEAAAFEKRAGEFDNLKGEMVAKVALLKAVDTIKDEAIRSAVTEMLKANDAGVGKAMETLGTKAGGAEPVGPEAALKKMAEELAETKKISFAKAYDAVCLSPEGRALYTDMYNATLPKVAV